MLTSQNADRPDVLSLERGLEALQSSPEFRGPVEELDGHDSNDHLALIYETQTEQFAAAVPFVRQGLQRGERCLYIADEKSRDEVLAALREGEVDVDAALESGALSIHSKQDTYLRGGTFDPDDMIQFLSDTIDEAKEEYEGLRVAAEMTWIFGDDPEIDDLIEYEGKVNHLMAEENCIALCQYNRERFPPEIIRDVIKTHPHLIYDDTVCQNFYYTPPDEFFGPKQPEREIERMMRTLADRTKAQAALQDREQYQRQLYEIMSSSELAFEEKLQALFDFGCERFDLELGGMARVDPASDLFEVETVSGEHEHLAPGAQLSLSETYCRVFVDGGPGDAVSEPIGIADPVESGFESAKCYGEFDVKAYLGTRLSINGDLDRTFFFVSSESRDEPFSDEERTFHDLMGQWVNYELGRRQREEFLQKSYDITSNPALSFDEKLEQLLELGREQFGLEIGCLTRLPSWDGDFRMEKAVGPEETPPEGILPVQPEEDCFCRRTIVQETPTGIVDVRETDWEDDPIYQQYGLTTYFGTAVTAGSKPYGTLWFGSPSPRDRSFSETERTFLDLMAQWVGYELEHEERERYLREQNEITASPDRSFEEKLQSMFELGCERFGLELGAMARVDPETDRFEIEYTSDDHEQFEPGFELPLSETYCAAATENSGAVGVSHPGTEYEDITVNRDFGLQAYLGTHVEVDGGSDRTFFFVSPESRSEEFSCDELNFHRLMGQWVSYELERKQREDRLAALNDLTQELMNAETAAEVSEYTVDAANEQLGLPVATVALYDPEEGSLDPASTTDAAADLVRATSAFDIGEGVGWQAFAENERKREADPLRNSDDAIHPPVTEVVALPLGNHGVLVTGATGTGGISPTELDFVETVAGDVNAALDRANREQQLHDREETLEEQNESLERLERINTTIRRIDQALVSASGRAEIANVVCRELADSGPYELAWFGKHDAVTDEIAPKASAGAENGYLDEIRENADDTPCGDAPSARAARTRKPQVVNEILDDPPFDPWRRAALSRGYHAVVSLPLVHEDTLFGVLSLYAEESGVFDDLERTVLGELSDTIAYAINAVESRKALVSNEVTELVFSLSNTDHGLVELVDETGCEFTYENVVPQANGRLRGFFTTRGVSPEVVREYVPTLPIDDLELLSDRTDDGEQVCLFEVELTEDSLAETVLEHGGTIDEFRATGDDAKVSLHVAADAAIREFVSTIETRYPDAEVVAKRTRERPEQTLTEFHTVLTDELTARQLETLQTAYFSGYFENPRTCNGSEIAASMDISQPTFNNHLRAAQRKLYRRLFEEETV